jgi:hypothetical protein
MRTFVIIIAVLLGTFLAPLTGSTPALASSDSGFVRIDVDNLQTKTTISATMHARLNSVTKDDHITLTSGGILQSSFLFPLATQATWSVTLSGDNGTTLLAVEGELKTTENIVEYRVLSARVESQAIEPMVDVEAVSLVVGRVSGSLKADVIFMADTDAVLSVGIDTNSDGKVADVEVVSKKTTGLSATAETPVVNSIPLTAVYEVKVISGDKVLASNFGSYDFAKGQNVKGNKFIDPKAVAELSVTHRRVPFVAFIKLPNTIFQMPEGEMRQEAQPEESTVDVFKATETMAPAPELKNAISEEANASGMYAFEKISGFLSHYWPLLAVAGAVFVGIILLLKLVFKLK